MASRFASTRRKMFPTKALRPQVLDVRTFEYFLLLGTPGQPVQLTLQNAVGRHITQIVRRKSYEVLRPLRPKPPAFEFRVLSGNIGYVALNSFEDNSVADQFLATFDKIASTDALILDLSETTVAGIPRSPCGSFPHSSTNSFRLNSGRRGITKPAFRAWGRPISNALGAWRRPPSRPRTSLFEVHHAVDRFAHVLRGRGLSRRFRREWPCYDHWPAERR